MAYNSSASGPLTFVRAADSNSSWEVVSGGSFSGGVATLSTRTFSLYAVVEDRSARGNGGAIAAGVLVPLFIVGAIVGVVVFLKKKHPEKLTSMKAKMTGAFNAAVRNLT